MDIHDAMDVQRATGVLSQTTNTTEWEVVHRIVCMLYPADNGPSLACLFAARPGMVIYVVCVSSARHCHVEK